MDDRVIDFEEYLEGRDPSRTYFGVWGGEGARAKFALPTWRAVNVIRASRAGLVYVEEVGAAAVPFFVLDLGSDDPRTDFSDRAFPPPHAPAPELHEDGTCVIVHLCEADGLTWYMVLDGSSDIEPLTALEREQLLFFAGECAGLLTHRGLATGEIGEDVASKTSTAEDA